MTSSEVVDKITKAIQSSAPMTTASVEMPPTRTVAPGCTCDCQNAARAAYLRPSLPISSIKPKIVILISRTSP